MCWVDVTGHDKFQICPVAAVSQDIVCLHKPISIHATIMVHHYLCNAFTHYRTVLCVAFSN